MSNRSAQKPMPSESGTFDPFVDRTARDIRNRLSSALIRAIEEGDITELASTSAAVCPPGTGSVYRDFVNRQMERYRRAFARIRAEQVLEPLHRAVVLWNEGLFFEVHEILESVWNGEERRRKEALRGLIQAAGVFIHRERGAARAAATLAARAASHLRRHRPSLAEIVNVEELIEAMEEPGKPAPMLRFGMG